MLTSLISVLSLAAAAVNAAVHSIEVGEGSTIKFNPNTINAAVGDTLEFHFYSGTGSHSVVSSAFESPCTPNKVFYSDYINGDATGAPTFVVNVTSTDPIYFYCSLKKHCQNGMVGVVNAPSGKGFAEYSSAAKGVTAAAAPDAASGGSLTTITGGSASSTSSMGNTSMTAVSSGSTSTSTSGSVTSSVAPSTTPTGSAAGGSSKSSSSSATSPTSSSASATPSSGAGKTSQTQVVVGLAVILGGLVALMA